MLMTCHIFIQSDILSGNEATLGEDEPALNSNDLPLFKYAPVTSCDVERSFSSYKTILRDNRRRFSFETLKCTSLYIVMLPRKEIEERYVIF
jgi:hypothetical protein